MHVSIQVGDAGAATAPGGAPGGDQATTGPAGDAGPGPGGASAEPVAGAQDSGPPPDWLLEAVSRAEAAGDGAATSAGGALEAGAGPPDPSRSTEEQA